MKITVIVLFACFCNLFATEANSQNAKMSIHADNLSLREIIYKIEKQTEYLFVYDRNEVDVNRQISVNADNESVSEVLNKIFTGTNIEYKLVGKNVTLIKRDDLSRQNGISQQSTKKIIGIVTDEKGEPIIRTSNRLRSFFRNGYFWSKAIKTKRLLILQKYNSIQTPFY